MSESKLQVGFIGIGAMGTPMSNNLLDAGFPLTIYDRNPKQTVAFMERGVTVAASCSEVAANSDVVLMTIGTVADDLEAALGESGVLEGARLGMILIDHSTVGIAATKKIAEAANAVGVRFLDATISGSVDIAEAAELGFMVGGDADTLEEARPVLEAMSKEIHHLGPNGSGSMMKVIINLMIGMTVLTVAETLTLGRQAGLDPNQMLEILGQTSVRSPHLTTKGRMMIDRQFEAAFALKYMQKDFDLIMEAAHELKTPMFLSSVAHQVYTAANVSGDGDLDYSSVVTFLEEAAAM